MIGVFGRAPANEYLVFFHWRPDLDYGGGVSRRNAMVMNIGKEWMEDLPANLGPTFAHELFHAWNSGAIHPRELHEVDFARENYTRFLWFIEGVTNYYVELAFASIRSMSEQRFLRWLSQVATDYERSPGRGWLSLSEADMANWAGAGEYVDASSGGHLVGLLLDLEIRRSSGNARSLDDVMRTLYRHSEAPDYRGYSETDFVAALSAAAGRDMGTFLRGLVEERVPGPYDALLATVGVAVRRTEGTALQVELELREDRSPAQVERLRQIMRGGR